MVNQLQLQLQLQLLLELELELKLCAFIQFLASAACHLISAKVGNLPLAERAGASWRRAGPRTVGATSILAEQKKKRIMIIEMSVNIVIH